VQRRQYRIESMLSRRGAADALTPSTSLDTLRHQLAALLQDAEGRRLTHAAADLGTAIEEMEKAALMVLGIAERVEERAGTLGGNTQAAPLILAEVQRDMARIYEACTFQDLAGQRIAKVIALLTSLDQVLSGAIEEHVDTPPTAPVMLNGPRLDGASGHITQDEIDAIFGYPAV
jgi:chemotaxis protein CheZ